MIDSNQKNVACGCRGPKRHPDCAYCGSTSWSQRSGEVICGQCSADGIDGNVIVGTKSRQCAEHKGKKTSPRRVEVAS